MQTFLPYPCFFESAVALDYRRLGKQRVEAMQIRRALGAPAGSKNGWRRHPAVLMWRGFEQGLELYHDVMILEWVRRGYRNTMALFGADHGARPPSWFGDAAFHLSHQSNLLRKDPEHYRPIFGLCIKDDLEYVWPAT